MARFRSTTGVLCLLKLIKIYYRTMKIAYCTDSICYAGGIQRVTIAKANKLALKNEVWIIVTDNKDKPVFPFPLR